MNITVAGTSGRHGSGWGAVRSEPHPAALFGPGAPDDDSHRMVVRAVLEALKDLPDGASAQVAVADGTVVRIVNEWLPDWRTRGWKKATKGSIANLDLWQDIAGHLDRLALEFTNVPDKVLLESARALAADGQSHSVAPETTTGAPAISVRDVKPTKARLLAYADGGCRGNPGGIGGWGMILVDTKSGSALEKRGGERESTNNRMEITGGIEALACLTKDGQDIEIRTDSKYLVELASKWVRGWKRNGWKKADGEPVKNVDLVKRLDELQHKHKVTWTWVAGHAGEPGNERVDSLANQAMDAIREGRPAAAEKRHEQSPIRALRVV